MLPSPRLAMAVDTPTQGWVILPAPSKTGTIFPSANTGDTTHALMVNSLPFWQWNGVVTQANQSFSWSLGGTLPNGQGTPLAVVVLLEENNPTWAGLIGKSLLETAIQPYNP